MLDVVGADEMGMIVLIVLESERAERRSIGLSSTLCITAVRHLVSAKLVCYVSALAALIITIRYRHGLFIHLSLTLHEIVCRVR